MEKHDLVHKAFSWLRQDSGDGFLTDLEHSPTRDVFQARLEKLRTDFISSGYSETDLMTAVVGEVGSNAYDHNLGSWRDVPGIYFVYDVDQGLVVIADRGQGIRRTITRVRPDVADDISALRIAYTEQISGRSPEQRGNGLKFVSQVVKQQGWHLACYSGQALLTLDGQGLEVRKHSDNISGCIIIIDQTYDYPS